MQKLRENHETIQQLTSQLQQMQEQMNSMNDSGDFQDVESNFCGRLSHVSSQPVMIPSSRSLISRNKRLPLDTWNQSGLQENVFGNQFSTFDSPRDKEFNLTTCKETEMQSLKPEGRRLFTHVKTDMIKAQSQRRHLQQSRGQRDLQNRWNYRWNYMVGQQRQQISELQFYKFPDPQSFFVWKIRFKTQVTTCSDFPSDAVLWIKGVEMVDSLDELKISRSVCGKDFTNFEMQDAKIACALNKIIQNSQFKKKVSLEEQKAQKEDRFLRGRQIAFMIHDYFRVTGAHSIGLRRFILCYFS